MKKFEKIKTVVFPVAGIGTRFLPATKSVAKELIPILNRPLIEYAVEEAQSCGFEKFVFVLWMYSLVVSLLFSNTIIFPIWLL